MLSTFVAIFIVRACQFVIIFINFCKYISQIFNIPYSRKYWRELNLAVEPKIAITRILADLNLVVRYGIAIHMYICE